MKEQAQLGARPGWGFAEEDASRKGEEEKQQESSRTVFPAWGARCPRGKAG